MNHDHQTARKAQLYTRSIKWSDEDACYIGSLPEICGNCCHGDTVADVCTQLDEIAQEWVELEARGEVTLAAPGSATYIAPSRFNESANNSTAIAAIRRTFDCSQSSFALLLGVTRSTVAQWEQGRRKPDGAAARLLEIASKHPEIIRETATA